ncbi:hypothetical protein E1B28_009745 [Marasmius oreades]|uniref:Uncharacterized protein n=1 Tax=Marasmius oreades TaxID=181124 RepID=A0A9P7RVQ5_9AGAR|nr:uncharacterized protein E1B28_009745 [Marasmius oreades]KAG7090644.1 hypothetical protein E1B28_009745 [Marasmius oreades]
MVCFDKSILKHRRIAPQSRIRLKRMKMYSTLVQGAATQAMPPQMTLLATEGGVLRKKYDDLSRAITSLDFQMNLLRANMEVLKREQLGSKFDVYKTVLHPCRCLPNEVLAIIFGLCVDEEVDIRKLMGSTLDTKKSP